MPSNNNSINNTIQIFFICLLPSLVGKINYKLATVLIFTTMSITILAVESSCDDTSAAIIKDGKILANCIANQTIHAKYGGVIPEMASRKHQLNIVPVVDAALKEAGVEQHELSAIAFTQGPGLLGSLLVGNSFCKAMAFNLSIPLITVNHMIAHVMAHFIDDPKPQFPFLCLTVSGGHTQIVKVTDYLKMEVIGNTLDDAAGEAFDKSAKLLGFSYPGGPLIDKHSKEGNPEAFTFGKPKIQGLNFSFSGVKTSILYYVQKQLKVNPNFIEDHKADLCASIQQTIVDILLGKLKRAAKEHGINHVSIAGGVSANSALRKQFEELGQKLKWNTYIPKFEYCTDNAAMIAITAHYKYLSEDFASLDVPAMARMKF